MNRRPEASEAEKYYWRYIDKVPGNDVIATLESQLDALKALLGGVPEERSFYRYAPGKWSIREVVNHMADTERAFAFRALWFARGFTEPLGDFDQHIAATGAEADRIPLAAHLEEFTQVRLSTLALFRTMPEAAWARQGVAGGNPVTVRAVAFIAAGHVAYHLEILRERYFEPVN
jgi:hypothetical protein